MVVNTERERREEDAILDAQQRAANQGRSRRARERLEALRQAEIESARAAAGLCVRCGGRLGWIARRLGARRHRGCKGFTG